MVSSSPNVVANLLKVMCSLHCWYLVAPMMVQTHLLCNGVKFLIMFAITSTHAVVYK